MLATSTAGVAPHDHNLAAAAGMVGAALERLQTAEFGCAALDALVNAALRDISARPGAQAGAWIAEDKAALWSTDVNAALTLLPLDFNFSLGQRDGVCWAWIQPNDDWQPGELDSRHDHPGGSGLVVARTPALALTCAAIMMYAQRLAVSA